MPRDLSAVESAQDRDEGRRFTRRTALALLGAGGIAAAASGPASASHGGGGGTQTWTQNRNADEHDLLNLHALDAEHVFTPARTPDRVVWKDGNGTFHADGPDGEIANGGDVIDVAQAAVNSLTAGRDWKETVAVVSPGTVGPTDSSHELVLPSYTVLDAPTTITVDDSDPLEVIPVKARDADHVEVRNLTVRGAPEYTMVFNSVSNLRLENIAVEHQPSGAGTGIRIDGNGGSGERSADIQAERIYGENVDSHLFETRRVDRVQVDQVVARNVSGCTVLLNETADATVSDVIEYSPNPPNETDYATFRTTYQQGRVAVDNVVSHQADRGLHLHTGSGELVINNVYIDSPRGRGAVMSGPPNTVLDGGVIKNCDGKAIDLYTISDPETEPERRADGVKLTNLRIYDDRSESNRTQTHAIAEAGNAQNNQFVDNDVRDGGTDALIETASPTTVVRDNVAAGVAEGTVTLTSGSSPAAWVDGVSGRGTVTLDLRAKPVTAPGSAFAYDHDFRWDGSEWDLVVEWVDDPGHDVDLDYIVDRPQANIGREP